MARDRTLDEDSVVVRASVPAELAAAIDSLVGMTGTSKATFMRQVIFAGLAPYALLSPDLAASLPASPYERKNS